MAPRVKKLGHGATLRVQAVQIGTLVQIAVNAGEREVFRMVGSAMDLGNNVLEMQWSQRRIVLAEPAIFAAVVRAPSNAGLNRRVHRFRLAGIS